MKNYIGLMNIFWILNFELRSIIKGIFWNILLSNIIYLKFKIITKKIETMKYCVIF